MFKTNSCSKKKWKMEHLFFIALCAVCICFNQIFYIGRRNLTLLLTLHSLLKRTYSLIFLLFFPKIKIPSSSATVGMGLNAAWARGDCNKLSSEWRLWSQPWVCGWLPLPVLHCYCPFCEMGMVMLMSHVWWLAISWRKVLHIQDSIQCYCPPLLFKCLLLWAPLPSCYKEFSSQRFNWEKRCSSSSSRNWLKLSAPQMFLFMHMWWKHSTFVLRG